MAGNDVVTIRLDGFASVRKKLPAALQNGIRAVAFAIEQRAKYYIVQKDAVDTGALLNSVYTAVPRDNGAGRYLAVSMAAAAAATDGKHSKKPHPFTTADEVEITGAKIWAKVAVAASYGGLIENGSPGGRVKARPYMLPASEDVRPKATEIVRAVLKKEVGI